MTSAGNGLRPIGEVEEEVRQAAEVVFAATEQDTFYDCSGEEGPPWLKETASKKKSAAKKMKKTNLELGGNCKEGGRDRGSKRGREGGEGMNQRGGERRGRVGSGRGRSRVPQSLWRH